MGIYLNPGNDNFQIACNSEIYVDKTGMIKHTNRMICATSFLQSMDLPGVAIGNIPKIISILRDNLNCLIK